METIKTSKIKVVKSIKPYNGTNGTVYYHLLDMENGDKINIGKKKELQVSEEICYQMIEVGQQEYNKSKSAQPEQPAFTGGFKKQQGTTASFALAYAKDWCLGLHNAGTPQTADHVIMIANVFNKWLKENG